MSPLFLPLNENPSNAKKDSEIKEEKKKEKRIKSEEKVMEEERKIKSEEERENEMSKQDEVIVQKEKMKLQVDDCLVNYSSLIITNSLLQEPSHYFELLHHVQIQVLS